MAITRLNAKYKDKDLVKKLGAKWDAERGYWYVPEGLDLEPFGQWIPAADALTLPDGAAVLAEKPAPQKGIRLVQLLAELGVAVQRKYPNGVWTTAEISKVDSTSGHYYLQLADREADGTQRAQARAIIWASVAASIVPGFEGATGARLEPGIKILVCARPEVSPQHGLSLIIEAIDPQYTLGDLEARKREIRERLKREGIFDNNKKVNASWDFNVVLVVAPAAAAGLGDFRAEANRLQAAGLCEFVLATSRFQGEGAPAEIIGAIEAALATWPNGLSAPDALVIIRGGGPVNDLAWLNDYELAKLVCTIGIPVLTGIGHERDSTLLDEVAQRSFDTPSKVIHGIERVIQQRAEEARRSFETITRLGSARLQERKADLGRALSDTLSGLRMRTRAAREMTSTLISTIRLGSMDLLARAKEQVPAQLGAVSYYAQRAIVEAKEQVPAQFGVVRYHAQHAISDARANSQVTAAAIQERSRSAIREASNRCQTAIGKVLERVNQLAQRVNSLAISRFEQILERSGTKSANALASIDRTLLDAAKIARQQVALARERSDAAFREINAQGPHKTLRRGFAIVRDAEGAALTRAANVQSGQRIRLTFDDGDVHAVTKKGEAL